VDPVLRVENLLIQYGGVIALKEVSFTIGKGERVGLIGPNGAGKTSVVNVLSGFKLNYQGQIYLNGNNITKLKAHQRVHSGLARSFQAAKIYSLRTVAENVETVQTFSKADTEFDLETLNPELFLRRSEIAGSLPYGLQKQLGCILAHIAAKIVLLLDEPAAGLAVGERPFVDFMIQKSVAKDCAVLLIEHDMDMIRRNCDRIIVLSNGTLIADGKTEEVLQRKDVIESYLGEEAG
jgi:branched-chain amino acid transport system ATP-binding protein